MNLTIKKLAAVATATALTAAIFSASVTNTFAANPKIKNVIMMVPDGMSVTATTLSRYMLSNNEKGIKDLAFTKNPVAMVKTTWADGPITDSAPAATALATGYKANPGTLGIDNSSSPKATVLEAAQKQGKATGVIATSEFMHATPAGYTAHDIARSNYAAIAEQMLNQDLDVMLGTGSGQEKVADLKVTEYAIKNGYDVVSTRSDLLKYNGTKLWGDFTNSYGTKLNMSYDMDRKVEEPSLADMTKKAIDVLNKDKDGFFLMVEGSKIDWAAHANDTIGIISDTLAFDSAYKAAYDFAVKDKSTVILVVSDHGNSGITIGARHLEGYDKAPFSILSPLKNASKTAEGALALISGVKDPTDTQLNKVLTAYGIDPRDTEISDEIEEFKKAPSTATLVETMNKKAYIGYTTGGHTGEDLTLWGYAPSGTALPSGLIDNTDIPKYIEKLINLNLSQTTKNLFVDVTNRSGATIDVKTATLTLKENNKTAVIKANTSTAKIDGKSKSLNGEVALYINGKFYVPQCLLDSLK